MIPENTDVLITHSPPYGILDANTAGRRCGCKDLRDRIDGLRLRLHCFGHIHASAGTMKVGDTMYVNASMVDRTYKIVRRPVQVEL